MVQLSLFQCELIIFLVLLDRDLSSIHSLPIRPVKGEITYGTKYCVRGIQITQHVVPVMLRLMIVSQIRNLGG